MAVRIEEKTLPLICAVQDCVHAGCPNGFDGRIKKEFTYEEIERRYDMHLRCTAHTYKDRQSRLVYIGTEICDEIQECVVLTSDDPTFEYIFDIDFWAKLPEKKKNLFLNPKGRRTK